ncbi:MAG: sigma-70 family RNA polymerase sigma factor [Actinomycetota bacterium]|nr:sigma-70 family RNA polymerase sigma factor [Actinomycetota bacterium]
MQHAQQLVAEGGALEFDAFYREHFERVYRSVWLVVRDRDQALDAAQEAFSRAYARWRRLSEQDWAAGWVIVTALNASKPAPRRAVAPAPEIHSAQDAEGAAARTDLSRALRLVPTRQRKALVLYYVGDLSVASIAQIMQISEGTVKAHLSQGRASLRRSLGEDHDR